MEMQRERQGDAERGAGMAQSWKVRACSHFLRLSTDLIDFAWGACEMHCGSVRPFGSVACVKKLRNVQLFRQRLIRRPIRSQLCKYTPRVSWLHFAITSRKKPPVLFFKEMWNDSIVFSHLLFVSSFVFISRVPQSMSHKHFPANPV